MDRGPLGKITATGLYCESHYEKQSQTLLLLHDGGLSSKQWQPQIGCLRDFHLLLPDMPEQGKTDGEFELNDATKRIADLIAAQAHGAQAHVVGLSLGGAIVLELLHACPERVQTAIVMGTSGKLNRMLGQVLLWQADLGRLFSAKWVVNMSIRMFGIEAYRDLVYEDLLRATAPGFTKRIAQSLMAAQIPTRNKVPLLVLVGEKETGPAKRAARGLAATIPNASGATVPRVGHVWNLQNPILFCDVVRLWASRQQVAPVLQAF